MTKLDSRIEKAAALLIGADALIVAAGAGMGVDSGLPDFRGDGGFWKAYPALEKSNLDFYSVACPTTFVENPTLAWGFYGHRLNLYRNTRPHSGFEILSRWGSNMTNGCNVFTSNVDGQFQKAGFSPDDVHECHGSIHHLQCLDRCSDQIWSAKDFSPEVNDDTCLLSNSPPVCPRCGGLARPNILMFGDWGWVRARTETQFNRQQRWLRTVECPVVIELGAGTHIPSVRDFSHLVVRGFNGRVIRINPSDCEVPTHLDIGLPLPALDALLAIENVLQSA